MKKRNGQALAVLMIVIALAVLVSSAQVSGSTGRTKGKNFRLVVTETSISKGPVPGLHSQSRGDINKDYTKVAYGIFKKGRCWVAVNGVKSKEYLLIGNDITFTANDRLVYIATRCRKPQRPFVVVDGVETEKVYDGIFRTAGFFFKGNNTFRTVAVRNEELFWVDVRIGGGASAVPKIRQKTKPETTHKTKPKNDPKDKADRECKAWLNIATIYINHDRPKKAKIYLKRIISVHPKTNWSKKAQKILSELD